MSNTRPYPLPTEILPHFTVSELLRRKPSQLHSVTPDDTVYRAVDLMAKVDVGALPVIQDGRLVGIVSERDYARRIVLMGRRSQETLVATIMSRKVITVSPYSNLKDCMQLMTEHQIRHLLVVDQASVIGMVTVGDVVRAVLEQQNQTIDELNRYVSGEPRLSPLAP
jgi:CBS domain-containing protein